MATLTIQRRRFRVSGSVQGVGFRPFVHHLASKLGLTGFVENDPAGVTIEVEGPEPALNQFAVRLESDKPRIASIDRVLSDTIPARGERSFSIRDGGQNGEKLVRLLPDLKICGDCLAELFDPANRRYRYPFINCTQCGPRYSIVKKLPYDRPNTTMSEFAMCRACQTEYNDPADRRFHAQPIACPACGPRIALRHSGGKLLGEQDEALIEAEKRLRSGEIVALKGLGGFHLLADARNDGAVMKLRERKHRPAKPFAVMFPDIETAESFCFISAAERAMLLSPASPIVLLSRKNTPGLSSFVAPDNPDLGVLIPTTPLHALLTRDLGFPVIATSGNLTEEPICFEEKEALRRLSGVADVFLTHNRAIVRPMEDSVVTFMMDEPVTLRAARGLAPVALVFDRDVPPLCAAGGHLKNTIAISTGRSAYVSQHVGDLDSPASINVFWHAAKDLSALYDQAPVQAAHDLHPDYYATQAAKLMAARQTGVQHHHAHIAACLAEYGIDGPVFGVAWDGGGFGPDGTVWGGEFLQATLKDYKRVGRFAHFPLPGGETAVREPRRAAAGVLYALYGDQFSSGEFSAADVVILKRMMKNGINSPLTSSAGRLFDAAASLFHLKQVNTFEGEAAMAVEFAARRFIPDGAYPFRIQNQNGLFIVDWKPIFKTMLDEIHGDIATEKTASRFQYTLALIIRESAAESGQERVVLSGGCFQNKGLLETAVRLLRSDGHKVYWPKRFPPNDGGLSLGQLAVAIACA